MRKKGKWQKESSIVMIGVTIKTEEFMKTEYIVFLVLAVAVIGGYVYAVYDSYKYRKCKQSKLVVLRLNNSYVRKLLK